MNQYTPSPENVRPLGRTLLTEDGSLWLAYSGSGTEFVLTGTKAAVTISGDEAASLPDNEDNQARIAIEVNGVRVVDDMIDAPEKTYAVLDCEQPQETVVRVLKLSETAMSTCGILSIGADAPIRPTAAPVRRIEFVGDSITCGYGVDDEDGEHHFSTRTEDVTRAYAYLTAQQLEADYSMVAISGYGMISGFTGTGEEPVTTQILPQHYDKQGFCYHAYRGRRAETTRWHFDQYVPELIVINLGTNDDSYTRDVPERQETYAIAYTGFLKRVRAENPDAYILCTLGIMGGRLYPFMEQAVAAYAAATGDRRVSCMRFEEQRVEDGRAADYHPTARTHERAAARLTAHIRELMGW